VLTGADGVKHIYIDLGTQGARLGAVRHRPDALGLPAGTYKMAVETSTKRRLRPSTSRAA
jgi:hypothetical protein